MGKEGDFGKTLSAIFCLRHARAALAGVKRVSCNLYHSLPFLFSLALITIKTKSSLSILAKVAMMTTAFALVIMLQ